jgi:hypothetical protein
MASRAARFDEREKSLSARDSLRGASGCLSRDAGSFQNMCSASGEVLLNHALDWLACARALTVRKLEQLTQ